MSVYAIREVITCVFVFSAATKTLSAVNDYEIDRNAKEAKKVTR